MWETLRGTSPPKKDVSTRKTTWFLLLVDIPLNIVYLLLLLFVCLLVCLFVGITYYYLVNALFSRGETSAGKSSFLNMILGENLLPYSVLSTTSTICELKYGRERRVEVHFKDRGERMRTVHLVDNVSYMEQISQYVKHEREEDHPYKRVEIYLPHPLLKVTNNNSNNNNNNNNNNNKVLFYIPLIQKRHRVLQEMRNEKCQNRTCREPLKCVHHIWHIYALWIENTSENIILAVMKQLKQLLRKLRKNFWGFNGIRMHALQDTGAMLYQLNYEAVFETGQD